jgi:hypothetical protein
MLTPEQANAMMMQQQQQAQAMQYNTMGTMPVPMTGPSVYPPQFSYGAGPHAGARLGHMGNGIVPGMVNAIPGAIGGVGMAAGIGTMFSSSSSLAALSMLDPFAAAFAAGGIGMGGGLGMAAGGALLAGGTVAAGIGTLGYNAKQFGVGTGQQQALGEQLSGMNFANPMAASGRGFDFKGLHDIGKFMREFEKSDVFVSMGDMQKTMDRFLQQGMGQGVVDPKAFAKKFGEYAESIKMMAETMGTTMDAASQTYGQMRQAGFYNAQDVMGNTYGMRTARGMGMEEGVFHGMQAGAAGTARSMQMTGRSGALTSSMFAGQLMAGATDRSAGGAGLYNDTYLMDITGQEDLQSAASQLAQGFTGSLANFLRNGAGGRALLGQVGTKENGSYTGGVDSDALAAIAEGRTSLSDVGRTGGSRINQGGRAGALSFTGKEHDIASSLLADERGAEAIFALLEAETNKLFAADGGASNPDNLNALARNVLKMDALQAELLVKTMQNRNELKSATAMKLKQEKASAAYQLDLQRNRSFAGVKQKISGGWSDFWNMEQVGADYQSWKEQAGQDIEDWAFDIERYNMTLDSRGTFSRELVTGTGNFNLRMEEVEGYGGKYAHNTARFAIEKMGGDPLGAYASALRGDLSPEQVAPGGYDSKYRSALDNTKRQQAQRLAAQIEAQEAAGNTKQADFLKKEFQTLANSVRMDVMVSEGHDPTRDTSGQFRDYTGKTGSREAAASWLAAEIGDQGLAKTWVLQGKDKESNTFKTRKALRKEMEAAVTDIGLTPGQERELIDGGTGTSVLAYMGKEGLGQNYFEDLLTASPGGDITELFNEATGQNFSEEDVLAARNVATNMTDKQRGATPGSFTWGTYTGDRIARKVLGMEDVNLQAGSWKRTTRMASEQSDTNHWMENQDAVRAEVSLLSKTLQSRLGAGDLKTLGSATSPNDYRESLGRVFDRIAAGDIDGIEGGGEMVSLVKRNQEATSVEDLKKLYNLNDEQLKLWGGSSLKGEIDTKEEIAEIQRNLGANELNAALTASGGSGALVHGGMTYEGQMLYNMGLTAEKVGKMAEGVDNLLVAMDKQGLLPDAPAGKDAK